MENQYQLNARGHRIYPTEVKQKILAELGQGRTRAELSREYRIPIQSINKWQRDAKKAGESTVDGSMPEATVPISIHRREVEELEKQLKRAKKALAEVSIDRDILKDAVEMASKKKWI